jgi:nitrous oxidase accessory protein NosD
VNCEPNRGEEVRNVHFRRCTFRGNANVGLYLHRALGVRVANASVQHSLVEANGYGIVASRVDGITIRNNRVRGHRGRKTPAIVVGESERPVIAGNVLDDNYRGIFSAGATAAEIRENTSWTGAADARARTAGTASSPAAVSARLAADNGSCCAGSGSWPSSSRVRLRTRQGSTARHLPPPPPAARSNPPPRWSGAGGRYDAIELGFVSSDNTIATNVIRLGAGTRQAIGICAACRGNQVTGNVVLPY